MIMCYLYIRTKANPVRDYRSVEIMARKHEGAKARKREGFNRQSSIVNQKS
jgi:hypothetical protein